jgi:predicted nucleotidyltransferase
MKFGLDARTINLFHRVFTQHPEVESVIIYGSRAMGTHREGSDIDLTLVGQQVTERLCSKLWLELDELNTPYLIDLSVFHNIQSKSLLEHIERVGAEFYNKSKARLVAIL